MSDALGGALFKPTEDPLEYLWSFAPQEVPLHKTAPDPLARHEADKENFSQHAAELERLRQEYDQRTTSDFVFAAALGCVVKKPTKTQVLALNKVLKKDYGLYSPELSGLKWRKPKHSTTDIAEKEVSRTPFEESLRDDVDADVTIINHDDDEYRRNLAKYGEVFRQYYGETPDSKHPEVKRDVYLLETALSKEWKSEAERKEWQRRLDMMNYFIHGVCPTGTCINNRCADPKLDPSERTWTHAVNRLQKVAPAEFAKIKAGTYSILVILQGQPRLKILKAKTPEQADTEIQQIIESSVKRARSGARSQNKSEKTAERRIRDAYRVADRLYCASEKYPQSNLENKAAD